MPDKPKELKALPLKFSPLFDGFAGLSHGFFGRQGGVSTGKYASLNTGRGSGDDPANVAENRKRVARAVGTKPERLISNHQIHSTKVVVIDKNNQTDISLAVPQKADAMVSDQAGIALSALSADCAPILFADMNAGIIGAAHAGWRGALAGVTDETVAAMVDLGAQRKNIIATIGPCLSVQHFEVGPEFVGEFITENLGNAKFFTSGKGDRSYFDIKAYLVRKLLAAGIGAAQALPDCTYGAHSTYFSYRYNCHNDITDYGRNISVIMRNE